MGIVPDERDIAAMPISKDQLRRLFEYLDRAAMDGYEADDSFSLTEQFLRDNQIPEPEILQWLGEQGAGCDIEVMLNVAENWEEIVGYRPPDEDSDDVQADQHKKTWWKIW